MLSVGWCCSLHYWNRPAQNQAKDNNWTIILSPRIFCTEGNSAAALLPSAERRSMLKPLSRGRGGIAPGLLGRAWQHHHGEKGQDRAVHEEDSVWNLGWRVGWRKVWVKWWRRAHARRSVSPWNEGFPGGQTPGPKLFWELGCLQPMVHLEVDLVGAVTTQSWCGTVNDIALILCLSQLTHRRRPVGADSSPPHHMATPFPWTMLMSSHDYTPQGGSSHGPNSNARVYTAINRWWMKGRGHASTPRTQKGDDGQASGCARRFAVGTACRIALEGSLRD